MSCPSGTTETGGTDRTTGTTGTRFSPRWKMPKKKPEIPLVLKTLLGRGCKFRVQYGTLYVTPPKTEPLGESARELIRASKERIVEFIVEGHLARLYCSCGRQYDAKGACWRCCDRLCERCGRKTGSAFIQQCCACGNQEGEP